VSARPKYARDIVTEQKNPTVQLSLVVTSPSKTPRLRCTYVWFIGMCENARRRRFPREFQAVSSYARFIVRDIRSQNAPTMRGLSLGALPRFQLPQTMLGLSVAQSAGSWGLSAAEAGPSARPRPTPNYVRFIGTNPMVGDASIPPVPAPIFHNFLARFTRPNIALDTLSTHNQQHDHDARVMHTHDKPDIVRPARPPVPSCISNG
jgi:hypothetical protein